MGRQRKLNLRQVVLLVISSTGEKFAEREKYAEILAYKDVCRIFGGFLLIKTVSFLWNYV